MILYDLKYLTCGFAFRKIRNPVCVGPDTKVSEAVLIMIERGFRHLPIVSAANGKILGVFSVRDALPREIGEAVTIAEFNDQVNDALG